MNKVLSGVKVIDLSTFVAAPTCSRTLADWGAQVLKIESPSGDPMRKTGTLNKMPVINDENPGYDLCNANKKGIGLNLHTEEGKKVLFELLDEAQVLVTNFRTAALKKMGLTYEQLVEKYPKIIFAQILGFGEKGPVKDRPGFDYTAYYARGGIQGTLYEKGTSPLNPVPGLGDNQAALFLAAGICAALYRQLKDGTGEKITVSLYHTAIFGMNILIASSQYGNHYPISRTNAVSPLLNAYYTKDGRWLQIAMPEYNKMYPKFMKAIDREDLADDERYNKIEKLDGYGTELVKIIEEKIALKNVDDWIEHLYSYDLPCEKLYYWEEILEDEQAWDNDFLYKMHYPNGHDRTLVTTPVKFHNMGEPEYQKGPNPGEHTEEILKNHGYSQEQIDRMRTEKVIF